MPRQSAAARAMEPLARPAEPPVPVQPPASLSEAGRAVFIELVGSCDPRHFEPSDVTLLARYANATVFSEQAEARLAADPNDSKALALWEKSTRTMGALALRLRLGPQSRREKAKVNRPLTWEEQFRLEKYGRL